MPGKDTAINDQGGIPRWNMSTVYEGFHHESYTRDKKSLSNLLLNLITLAEHPVPGNESAWIKNYIELFEKVADLRENLYSFTYAIFSTDTNNEEATRELNAIEEISLPLARTVVSFRNNLAETAMAKSGIPETLSEYRFFLEEQLELQKKQMSPQEEELAADLSRSGGDAWSRLQEAVSSNLLVMWDETSGESKTVTQLRALAFDPKPEVRQKAFTLELEAWRSAEIPIAYAMNVVKGFSVTLNSRRGFDETLQRSLLQSRINMQTLDVLVSVMKDSLPLFRRYLNVKARRLGIDRLKFCDLFAPLPVGTKNWSFVEARSFIVEHFASFSTEFAAFAQHAFDGGWIDAEPRMGKVGGAYCISYPMTRESRILCNFDGSFSAVSTLAHELGHAYHHHILRDHSHIHRDYPMTLAETASIFSQTIIVNAALTQSTSRERLAIVEEFLQDATQLIVDILSRFIFEQGLFARRNEAELSPKQLCELMVGAQKQTYGNALDESYLHPYMWAAKPHYYDQDYGFYNFPYAFGFLFGLALYGEYKQNPESFEVKYLDILGASARASAKDVTSSVGFDIESKLFWEGALEMVTGYVEEFETAPI